MIIRTFGTKEPSAVHAFEVTPDLLREWANRLESKATIPGQLIRMPFAPDAEFFYFPTSAADYLMGRSGISIHATESSTIGSSEQLEQSGNA